MNNKIIRLIKIADELDRLDMNEDADFIDSLIKDEGTDKVIDIPEDEYDLLQDIYKALGESLK
jgi:hypothetical protein